MVVHRQPAQRSRCGCGQAGPGRRQRGGRATGLDVCPHQLERDRCTTRRKG